MQRIIGVKFRDDGKTYFFIPPKENLNVGDKVVVETEDGINLAEVAFLPKVIEEDKIVAPLKKVLRKASKEDLKKQEEMNDKLPEIQNLVEEMVRKLNLDMKIVGVYSNFDGKKFLIEFTAEDRVDFRELLKQLASQLKARIELKQIGQRDEVKLKGGLGLCGQECCCHRFLNNFEHVSIKMAKNQGLALNPNSISGLCGKLMCCLSYENEDYLDILKKMPKINTEVETPDGVGKVVFNDIMKESVIVRVNIKGEEQQNIYNLDSIKFTKNQNGNKEEK